MKYSILITSLFGGKAHPEVKYYSVKSSERMMYCDAMLGAEASAKYMLANHHIDEIITLGSKTTYDPGDEVKQMVLREGSSFYSSDIESLSAYSLLRYRLAQYIDEIKIEAQDIGELLSPEEQGKMEEFFRTFFRKNIQDGSGAKYNRYFDILRADEEIKKNFYYSMTEEVPEIMDDPNRFRRWTLNYLYSNLKDTYKLELLPGNEDVKIRFLPTDNGLSFANRLVGEINRRCREVDEEVEIELYICILSEDANDSFALMNLIDVIKNIPSSHIKIKKIASASHMLDDFVSSITDDTELYGISDLLAGTRAFLRYGKTDLLMDYWNKQNIENAYIERLLYAMRNIDIGISLCDISDIERGIASLSELFQEDFEPGDDIVERYFDIIIDGIKEDYGVLVTDENAGYIEFVKWAYRKGFWQQTLTMIESRAPEDFVNNGIFYYMSDESQREQVVRVLGEIFYNLKVFEKYKLDDIDHYFVKFYGRGRLDRSGRPEGNMLQKRYTVTRMEDLDSEDDNVIRAYTNCTDRDLLSGLLYAYYVLGDVRNRTNHAMNDSDNEFAQLKDADVSERMSLIKQTIENFIMMYEKVAEKMSDEPQPVMRVSNTEVRAYAQTLKPYFNKDRSDRNRENKSEDKNN